MMGSFTVLIGNQPAARQLDIIVEPSAIPPAFPPNNPIMLGERTVLIGDNAFGLMSPAVLDAFCRDWNQLLNDWNSLTPAQRQQRMTDMVNDALAPSGTPPLNGLADSAPSSALGSYDPGSHVIDMPSGTFTGSAPDATVAQTLVHEARHAEQEFNTARHLASGAPSGAAGHITGATGMSGTVANAAATNPASLNTAAGQHGSMNYDSYYGAGSAHNQSVRGNPSADDADYYGLPEERDAEDVAVALTQRCPAANDPSNPLRSPPLSYENDNSGNRVRTVQANGTITTP